MGKRSRLFLWAVLLLFLGIVFADALGVFDTRPYTEITHGNHKHYVPRDRDPSVPLDNFPTRPPGPNERILPTGEIVPAN